MNILIDPVWIVGMAILIFILVGLSLGPKTNSEIKPPLIRNRHVDTMPAIRQFLMHVIDTPPAPMPIWMQQIIVDECKEHGIKIPGTMSAKYIGKNPYGRWKDGIGGYTLQGNPGEINVTYEEGKHFGTDVELNTLLHELAHWLVKDFDYESGGHTPAFYREFTRLTLKYNGSLDLLFEECEYEYGGQNLWPGLEMFESQYNLGVH